MSGRGPLADIGTICDALNARASSLAPELLPNGMRDGRHWKTSSVDDVKTGRYSLVVDLDGPQCGHWRDFGGARPGEDKGDMLDLVRLRKCGGDNIAAIGWAKDFLGITNGDGRTFEKMRQESAARAQRASQQAEIDTAKRRDKAKGLYLSAVPLNQDGAEPVVAYLAERAIDLRRLGKAPGALRYHGECWNKEHGGPLPAMVACIMSLAGEQLGTHRTWISFEPPGRNGRWVKNPRLVDAKMTYGPSNGGHIPVWKGEHACPLRDIPPGTDVYCSEGIEDGLSIAMADPKRRVISAVSLSKLGALELPEQMGRLIVIGQNDAPGSAAIDSLERCIGELQAKGRRVAIIYPPVPYKDFNEWLQADPEGFLGRREGVAA